MGSRGMVIILGYTCKLHRMFEWALELYNRIVCAYEGKVLPVYLQDVTRPTVGRKMNGE